MLIGNYIGIGNSSSRGGSSTAPSPLVVVPLSTTEMGVWWIKTGATKYTVRRSINSDMSEAVQVHDGTGSSIIDTGLTANTTYYYDVKATTGEVISSAATDSAKTLSVVPLHAYDFRGIPYNSSNIYGATGAPFTAIQVGEVYSYRGTANTLTPTTATEAVIQGNITTNAINKHSAYTSFSNNNFYTPASNIDLTTGDFTILIEMGKNTLGTLHRNIFSNSGSADIFLGIATSGARIRPGALPNVNALWPSTLKSHQIEKLIVKLESNTLYAGIMASDGTVSFGTGVAITRTSLVFDRAFIGETLWYLDMLNIYSQALTDAQIVEEFNRGAQPDYSFEALNKALTPKGIAEWSDLTSGYFIDADTVAGATSGASWAGLYTLGNYSFVRLAEKSALTPDFGIFYRHTDGKVGSKIPFGTPGAVADSHNISSIFPLDNTYYVVEQDVHYDKTAPTNLVIKRFGKDFDMSEWTQLPSLNGIASHRASLCQYPQVIKTANYTHVIVQEWNGVHARWITDFRFKDNCNSCEKIRLMDTAATNWLYHTVIHSEDDTIRVVGHYMLFAATDRYAYSAYIESDDDFETAHNLMYGFNSGDAAAFSKSISDNGSPLSVSELSTNCLMTHDGSADTNDNKVTAAYFDPTDGKVYGVSVNGAGDGLNFVHSVDGEFVEVAIDLLGHDIVCNYGEAGSIGHGSNIPTMVRTGANSYRLFCEEIVSAGIWKVVELSTTDSWATSSFVGDITDDDTTTHDRIMVTRNVHHTGGADAYTEKRLLVCSREQTSPDDHSDTRFYEI